MKTKNMVSKPYEPKLRIISEEIPNENGKSIWLKTDYCYNRTCLQKEPFRLGASNDFKR